MKILLLACLALIFGCQDNTPVAGPYPSNGLASWYYAEPTASGDSYGNYTCAMRKRGFGKFYLVCNLDNNRCVAVKHNDFGPARRLFDRGRIIDLSLNAFSKLADPERGLVRVRIGEINSENK